MSSVGLLVVGGYLGSGKSTLANHLLSAWMPGTAGVIVNDLAPVNVDADYVIEHTGPTVAMQDGCVCCSIANMLGAALDKLLEHRPRLERIVLEASGVSEPGRVAVYGQGWPGMRPDGVITVVDASDFGRRSQDKYVGDLVLRQVREADVVVVNKADTVDAVGLASVCAEVATLAPAARILTAVRGVVDVASLLPITRVRRPVEGARFLAPAAGVAKPLPVPVENFETHIVRCGRMDLSSFVAAAGEMQQLATRFKGVVVDAVDGAAHLVQSAGDQLEVTPAPRPGQYNETVLVFIVSGNATVAATRIAALDPLLQRLQRSNAAAPAEQVAAT